MDSSTRYGLARNDIYGLVILMKKFTLIIAILLITSTAYAQSATEYSYPLGIGAGIGGEITIVGLSSGKEDVDKLAEVVTQKAQEALRTITSDIARINAAGQGVHEVGWPTAQCLAAAKKVSKATKVDIMALTGSFKGANIDEKNNTVDIKKPDTTVSCNRIVNGYMANLVASYIHTALMQNALVRVGNAYRGMGRGLYTPWKMQIQEDTTRFAKRALDIQLTNTGGATLNAGTGQLKGVAVIFGNSAEAEGLAHVIMAGDATKGTEILARYGANGLLIDNTGKFIKIGM
jgi:thiamine biosynthesis lipoprotein ApbE